MMGSGASAELRVALPGCSMNASWVAWPGVAIGRANGSSTMKLFEADLPFSTSVTVSEIHWGALGTHVETNAEPFQYCTDVIAAE